MPPTMTNVSQSLFLIRWVLHRETKLCRFSWLFIFSQQFCPPRTPGKRSSILTSTLKCGPYFSGSSWCMCWRFRYFGSFSWCTSTITCLMPLMPRKWTTTANEFSHGSRVFRSSAQALSFRWLGAWSRFSSSFFGGFSTNILAWGTTQNSSPLTGRKKSASFSTTPCQLSLQARSTLKSSTASLSVSLAAPSKKPSQMTRKVSVS